MSKTDHSQDIFQALTAKHDIQRKLCARMAKLLDQEDWEGAKAAYPELQLELQAHAAAEERHLYIPVMQHDDGLDLSRHAITEHHEMDELMAVLDDGRTGRARWLKHCRKLIEEVEHHLREEEENFFKDARKILDAETSRRLGALYQVEHAEYEQKHG